MVHSRAKKKQLLDNIKKIVFTYSRLYVAWRKFQKSAERLNKFKT